MTDEALKRLILTAINDCLNGKSDTADIDAFINALFEYGLEIVETE